MRLSIATETTALVNLARGRYSEALSGLEDVRRQYQTHEMLPYSDGRKATRRCISRVAAATEALALFDISTAQFCKLEMPVEQAWTLTQRGRAQALLFEPTETVAESLHLAWNLFPRMV